MRNEFYLDLDLVSSRHELRNIPLSMCITRKYSVCVYSDYAKSYFDQGCDSLRVLYGVDHWRYGHTEYDHTFDSLGLPIYAQSKKDGMFYDLNSGNVVNYEIRKGVVICFDTAIFDEFVRNGIRLQNICYVLFCSSEDYTARRLFNEVTLDVNLYEFELQKSSNEDYYTAVDLGKQIASSCYYTVEDDDEVYNFFCEDSTKSLRTALRGIIREFIGGTKRLTYENYLNYYVHLYIYSPDFFTSVVYGNCDWYEKFSDKLMKYIYDFNSHAYIDGLGLQIYLIGFDCGFYDVKQQYDVGSIEEYYLDVDVVDFKSEIELGTAEPIKLEYELRGSMIFFDFKGWYFAIKVYSPLIKKYGLNVVPSKYVKDGYIFGYKTRGGEHYHRLIITSKQVNANFDRYILGESSDFFYARSQEKLKRLMLLE